MTRKIILDTETTGLKPEEGHRIIEIGAVELIQDGDNFTKTGKTYQVYLNPDRDIDPAAEKIHGITRDFLRDKPRFSDIIDDFIAFIKDADIVIHNESFDLKFLNSELDRCNRGKIWDHVKNSVCTLKLDKRLFPEEKKHTLDAMCERFGINNEKRVFHGALLDADLLADCYIKTYELHSIHDIEADLEQTNWIRPEVKRYEVSLPAVSLDEADKNKHIQIMTNIQNKLKPQSPKP